VDTGTTFGPRELKDPPATKELQLCRCHLMVVVLGVALYAATALPPLFMQELAAYTAELAGLVLSPAGLVLIVTMPIVGRLSSRVQARWLAATGFLITGLAL
jgi:MFS transporter, DHA2 family, multidrug resistance protein